MRCEQVMNTDPIYVMRNDSAQYAAQVMRTENLGFLPVCNSEGQVLGAVTDRDLALRICAEALDAEEMQVADVMTNEIVACMPDDELSHAEGLMAKYRKSRVLVTDGDGRLVGVLSLTDIVERDSNKHAARTLRKVVGREHRE